MIMSAPVQAAIQSQFSQLQPSICTTLQNTSVMLTGTTPGGFGFTGSGVILYTDGDYTYVVTAKHNLYVFNNQSNPPTTWDPSLLTTFQGKITINYDDEMAFGKPPGKTASIDAVQTVDIPSQSWLYDVMILKSENPDLMTFAQSNNVYPVPAANQGVVTNANQYLQKGNQSYFIQTGYGKVSDTASNSQKTLPIDTLGSNRYQTLQYRFTQPKANNTATVYNQFWNNKSQYYQFQNAVQVDADANNSTAPGDSGGPLFLVKFAGGSWGLYLIGITSGSDMALAQTPCPAPSFILENNIVTSLESCYRQGFNFS
jgi:hypothetical protein